MGTHRNDVNRAHRGHRGARREPVLVASRAAGRSLGVAVTRRRSGRAPYRDTEMLGVGGGVCDEMAMTDISSETSEKFRFDTVSLCMIEYQSPWYL
jgi:hypothetical protein